MSDQADARARAEAAMEAARVAFAAKTPGTPAAPPVPRLDTPAIVGPEVFVPDVPGTILPYGAGTYGGPGQLRVRSNQNLTIDGQFLTPDTEYTLVNTREAQDAIAAGALSLLEDPDVPQE